MTDAERIAALEERVRQLENQMQHLYGQGPRSPAPMWPWYPVGPFLPAPYVPQVWCGPNTGLTYGPEH